jgi:uncharacterized alkaline shock family protein YloU
MTDPNQPAAEKKPRRKKSQPVIPPDHYPDGPGRTTVAPEVLQAIARLTALETPGICRMSPAPGGVSRLRRGAGEGVLLDIQDDSVTADLYVVVKNNVNMREVSRNTQHNVARAISEMVGMQVGRVNIHIEDIEFPLE